MTTARTIITRALRKIHVLGQGQSLDANEAADALSTLNSMLSSWSAEGNLVYAETKETFSLTSAASYTIGSGGDFNTVRPLYIKNMTTAQGGLDYPVEQIDSDTYSKISLKALTSSWPDVYYYDAGYPLGTIYLYPKPTSGTITMTSVKPLVSFTALDTSFAMPDEYRAALEYNLSVWLAPEYEREASMTVQRLANETKTVIKSQNKRNEKNLSTIGVPDRSQQTNDILEGYFT